MANSTSSGGLSRRSSPLVNLLPGEIRNQIIELCIVEALKCPKLLSSPSKTSGITVSILPRWSGLGCLRMNGIGALPLLFVNKQLYKETLSFIDSMVDELCIGGYILQYPKEDPNIRWRLVYSLLDKRPNLQRFVKNVKVVLPRSGGELCQRHWASLGLPSPKISTKQNSWLVLPDLEKYLDGFLSCQKLVLVISADETKPPEFSELVSLYQAYRQRIVLEIIEPRFTGYNPTRVSPRIAKWESAWKECLSNLSG
ncbi:hypothetical protein EG329_006537 [Mollisiaceae sp. DMI_Dod_QoI]|nr:hypothetical protein EG329_006537 [Helotiales sp. DMI_Dod_QoI]